MRLHFFNSAVIANSKMDYLRILVTGQSDVKTIKYKLLQASPLPFVSYLKVAIPLASRVSRFKSFQSLLAKLIDVQWSHLRLAVVLSMLNLDLELYPIKILMIS